MIFLQHRLYYLRSSYGKHEQRKGSPAPAASVVILWGDSEGKGRNWDLQEYQPTGQWSVVALFNPGEIALVLLMALYIWRQPVHWIYEDYASLFGA
ncbi:hypothetical protein BJX64DRAFT_88089 [Aspergillus heterothallicus]